MVLPVVSFAFPKQEAKATSNIPAIIRIIQFILFFGKGLDLGWWYIYQMVKNERLNNFCPNPAQAVSGDAQIGGNVY